MASAKSNMRIINLMIHCGLMGAAERRGPGTPESYPWGSSLDSSKSWTAHCSIGQPWSTSILLQCLGQHLESCSMCRMMLHLMDAGLVNEEAGGSLVMCFHFSVFILFLMCAHSSVLVLGFLFFPQL